MFRRSSSRARRKSFLQAAKPIRRQRHRPLVLESLEERPLLAPFTVTNLNDAPVAAAGAAPGTLRQAIFDANNSGGADSIEFTAGLSGTITLTAGELLISESLTINGPGADLLTVDASGNDPTPAVNNGDGSRVFHISDGLIGVNNPVTINALTITGGDSVSSGGGIRSLENLALNDSVVTGNATTDDGAGIFVSTAAGLNSIVRSTISGNVAPTAGDFGGGMYAYTNSGGIAITESTFSNNRAYYGGGVFARAITGSVTITSSTLSGNDAGQGGGGIFLRTGSGASTIAHSTITDNTANADMGVVGTGGGVYAEGTGTLAIRHTIIAGNADLHPLLSAPDLDAVNATEVPTLDVSFSLIGDNTRSTLVEAQTADAKGNLIGDPGGVGVINALLAPLTNNGGPTQTHALSIGSRAVDAGNPLAIAGAGGIPTFDQRGNPFSRIREGNGIGAPRIDIGAFESALLLLPDLFEPNDSIAAATVLGSETEVALRDLTIHNEADEDFFKITAHDTGKLIVRAHFIDANGDLDMQIVDRFGNEIAASTSEDDDEDVIFPVVAQEMYFVRVYGFADATNEYSLEIENFASPIPSAIHLDPASDLGRLNDDNLTSDITPTFVIQADVLNFVDSNDDGVFDLPVLDSDQAGIGMPGAAVQVRIVSSADPTFVPIVVFADPISPLSPTLYRVTLSAPLPDGVYFASANTRIFDGQEDGEGALDPATGRSDLSTPLWFTIDTMKPNVFFGESAVATDGLDPSSDTSVASQPNTIVDRITSDSTPAFFGAAEANSTVRVYVRNNAGARVLIGETVVTPSSGNNPLATGRWSVTSTIDMNDPLLGFAALDGVRQFEVEAEDVAGNISPGSVFKLADVPQAITDDGTTEFTLEVAGLAGSITDLNVGLGITHTNVADLDVILISPAGTEVQLFADVGGSGNNFIGTTLDDEATTAIELGLAPFTGGFIPMELLAAFDGEDPNGTWTLRIVDDTVEDVGTLDAWTLCFQSSLDVFIDTQGPRVSEITIDDFDLINPKAGPTPTINELTISFSDLPARTADFLYPAVNQIQATTPGNYVLVGDRIGIVPIVSVTFTDTTVAGMPGTTAVTLVFASPLTDDRYTLTARDNLRDDVGNRLDGEYFGTPTSLPTGDGVPEGDFVVQFAVDALPELGVWAAGTVLIDANGNFVSNSISAGGDLAFHFGFSSDYIFAGNFSAIGGAADGFDKLAAYGRVGNQFRWLIDTNNDGVVDLDIPENSINGIPVAGNFDGNAANGDEVGIFTGMAWHLDTNHDFRVDSMYAASYGGFPIAGDFDGDGDDDLGTYVASQSGGNQFFIDLNTPAPGGRLHVDGNANHAFRIGVPQLGSGFFGFPGVRERPFAHDMNGDGVDDIGLWVPDGTALVPGDMGEWFIFLSGDLPYTPGVEKTLLDRIDNGFIRFSPRPFAYDYYAAFGNSFALPVVGNFDPPGPASTVPSAQPVAPTPPSMPAVAQTPALTRTINAPAAIDTKELVGADVTTVEPTSVNTKPVKAVVMPVKKERETAKSSAAKESQDNEPIAPPPIAVEPAPSVVDATKPVTKPIDATKNVKQRLSATPNPDLPPPTISALPPKTKPASESVTTKTPETAVTAPPAISIAEKSKPAKSIGPLIDVATSKTPSKAVKPIAIVEPTSVLKPIEKPAKKTSAVTAIVATPATPTDTTKPGKAAKTPTQTPIAALSIVESNDLAPEIEAIVPQSDSAEPTQSAEVASNARPSEPPAVALTPDLPAVDVRDALDNSIAPPTVEDVVKSAAAVNEISLPVEIETVTVAGVAPVALVEPPLELSSATSVVYRAASETMASIEASCAVPVVDAKTPEALAHTSTQQFKDDEHSEIAMASVAPQAEIPRSVILMAKSVAPSTLSGVSSLSTSAARYVVPSAPPVAPEFVLAPRESSKASADDAAKLQTASSTSLKLASIRSGNLTTSLASMAPIRAFAPFVADAAVSELLLAIDNNNDDHKVVDEFELTRVNASCASTNDRISDDALELAWDNFGA